MKDTLCTDSSDFKAAPKPSTKPGSSTASVKAMPHDSASVASMSRAMAPWKPKDVKMRLEGK